MDLKEKLSSLYNDQSKHSRYQNIPKFVREKIGYNEYINEEWRGDTARYNYILNQIQFSDNMKVADIGANTGFFTLSLAHTFKECLFTAYEPNKKHAEFIQEIIKNFDICNVDIDSLAIGMNEIDEISYYDIIIFLNIIHHAGIDFDREYIEDIGDFSKYAKEYITRLRHKTKLLIFQMGYNWGGDKTRPIIKTDEVDEMILFLYKLFLECGWRIKDIAVYSRKHKEYINLPGEIFDPAIIEHIDEKLLCDYLKQINISENSEFYKRPLVILENT